MSPESPYRFLRIEPRDDVVMVALVDCKVIDERKAAQVSSELNRLVDAATAPCRIHLDLSGVDYLTSTMLGEFVAVHRRLQSSDGQLALCNARPPIAQILEVTKMERIMAIIPSRATTKP